MPDDALPDPGRLDGRALPDPIRELAAAVRRNRARPAPAWGGGIVLIGAGCSVTAGIPAAQGVVDIALRHLAESWLRLDAAEAAALSGEAAYDRLKAEGCAFGQPYGAGLYYELFDDHLPEATNQRAVIHEAIQQGGRRINWAHLRLGQLVAERCFHTVLTTNFDQLALDGMVRSGLIPAVADGLESLNRVDEAPRTPQLVHVHGSLHNYTLRNSRRHVAEVGAAANLAGALRGLLRAAPFLLVVGYRGEEAGLMAPLDRALADLPDKAVFWTMQGETPGPEVQRLAATHRGVRILRRQDADALFDGIARARARPAWMDGGPGGAAARGGGAHRAAGLLRACASAAGGACARAGGFDGQPARPA
ncbi:MAG: SIR2 family protein [Acetobacteraceae bacterium]|nr:SIR2 family protein [Acetobacteraceae bacterium]